MSQNFTIVFRDLQTLLRETISSDVDVVNYETTNLLPKGEQYGSTMLKVEALVKKKTDSPEEKMYFVAKMLPTSKYQQEHLNMTNTFTKEIYIVQKLSEFYRELEREAGIKEEDLIDVFPKFCGGRLTKKKDTIDVADEDAVMLLENLKVRGYVMIDRLTGLNFEHAKLVITELAHFHALGTALKMKKPEIFETAKKLIKGVVLLHYASKVDDNVVYVLTKFQKNLKKETYRHNPLNTTSFEMKGEEFKEVLNYTIQILCEDPRINQYKDRVKRALTRSKGYDSFLSFQDIAPWISIGHGDVWKNNILFHYAENGKVDDVKFVDYQTTRVCSPLKDIPYFLCTSLESSVVDNHFDELLEIYHDKFVNFLAKISCDVASFTKKSFEEQLNRDAKDELFHCVLAIKFITVQVSEDMDDIKSAVLMSDVNQLYRDMSWRVVSKFVDKDWI